VTNIQSFTSAIGAKYNNSHIIMNNIITYSNNSGHIITSVATRAVRSKYNNPNKIMMVISSYNNNSHIITSAATRAVPSSASKIISRYNDVATTWCAYVCERERERERERENLEV
jgi:hypothetical protein